MSWRPPSVRLGMDEDLRAATRRGCTRASVPRAVALLAAWCFVCTACASIESGRYGVRSLEISGQRAASQAAITECLITREREHFQIGIGLADPQCNVPPFDASPVRLRLWRWPWTEWPSFNRAVFDRDLEGVLRFYRARGHYSAKIVAVHYEPEAAGSAAGRCEGDDCRVDIRVVVDEGPATLVGRVQTLGLDGLPPSVVRAAHAAIELAAGRPPDEALHDRSKRGIERVLYDAGWAGAKVIGRVDIDPHTQRADVEYRVEPGPRYHFGRVAVSGHGTLPREVIEKAADLETGQTFDPDVLREIQSEVFALGAFSAVEVEEQLDARSARADVNVRVTPLPVHALRVGAGVLSGASRRTETSEEESIPQWDVHLFGRYQRRHLLGSLAQLTLEDRPRLIFGAAFPSFEEPRPGNVASVVLTQPGWLEARTTAFARTLWDYGPDPFQGFFRSDLFLRVGLTRGFWGRRLIATLAAQQDIYSVFDSPEPTLQQGSNAASDDAEVPSSYRYTYLEQDLRLDLRNSRARSSSGAYFALNVTAAPRWVGSDWTAFRLSPEIRTYIPLPLDLVFAQRFALASLFVLDANPALDDLSRQLGPNSYRLRGGGASSNRGFLAGGLGVGLGGGTRRWETSLELRVPIGQSFVVAGFADFGDVSRGGRFHFGNLNTTLGYGLRYYTVIGAIRLDVGYRIPSWQRIDGTSPVEENASEVLFTNAPGAVHLTIGDPF
jgi:translocation and assembly module TamA